MYDVGLKAGDGLRHLPHRAHITPRIDFARREPGLESSFARKISLEVVGHLLPASMKYRKDRFVPQRVTDEGDALEYARAERFDDVQHADLVRRLGLNMRGLYGQLTMV
jgi:hypothetical protein